METTHCKSKFGVPRSFPSRKQDKSVRRGGGKGGEEFIRGNRTRGEADGGIPSEGGVSNNNNGRGQGNLPATGSGRPREGEKKPGKKITTELKKRVKEGTSRKGGKVSTTKNCVVNEKNPRAVNCPSGVGTKLTHQKQTGKGPGKNYRGELENWPVREDHIFHISLLRSKGSPGNREKEGGGPNYQ